MSKLSSNSTALQSDMKESDIISFNECSQQIAVNYGGREPEVALSRLLTSSIDKASKDPLVSGFWFFF